MISAKNSSRQRQVLSQLARAIEFDSLTLSNDQIAISRSLASIGNIIIPTRWNSYV
jgi:hypothetical protein